MQTDIHEGVCVFSRSDGFSMLKASFGQGSAGEVKNRSSVAADSSLSRSHWKLISQYNFDIDVYDMPCKRFLHSVSRALVLLSEGHWRYYRSNEWDMYLGSSHKALNYFSPDSGFRYFATRRSEVREVAGYYSGNLAYAHLRGQLKRGIVYGNGILSVSRNDFLTWAVCLNDKDETPDRDRDLSYQRHAIQFDLSATQDDFQVGRNSRYQFNEL